MSEIGAATPDSGPPYSRSYSSYGISSVSLLLLDSTSATRADDLSALFARKPGDSEVRLRLEKPRDFSVILDVASRVRPDKEFLAEVTRICGAEAIEVLAN